MRVSVKVLGPTRSEVHIGGGTVVFFSYETPVAAVHDGTYYQTRQKYSVTTSKHISRWRPPSHMHTKLVDEDFLAKLIPCVAMERTQSDVIEAIQVLRAALVPHMGLLPDIVMQKITKALGLLSPKEEEA